MSKLQDRVAEKFLKSLADVNEFDAVAVEELRKLLASATKPKPDDFVRIFTAPKDGGVK